MARTYSQPTLAAFIRLLSEYKMDPMTLLFMDASVPTQFDPRNSGAGRQGRALNVVKTLAENSEHGDTLDKLFDVVVADNTSLFEQDDGTSALEIDGYERPLHPLLNALRMDGYDIREGRIVPAEALETEIAQEISTIYQRLESLDWEDVRNNLEQAHDNYVGGYYESCNAMLRTALEATLLHIATDLAGGAENIPHPGVPRLGAGHVRNYLRQQEFTSEDEHLFMKTLYGFASSDGSHPGLSSAVEGRLRRLMIVACIQYCLEKFITRRS